VNTKEKILQYLKEKQSVTGKELSEFLGISRQAVNKHLKELIETDSIVKEGATRGAVYSFPSAKRKVRSIRSFRKTYSLQGLEEDEVLHEVASLLNLNRGLSESASKIARYAFTEILNNAIDHSSSEECSVDVSLDQYRFNFRIRDFGIGIFYSIFKKFDLPDENAVIGQLIKGKTTTMEGKH
jgi:predicted transcriptional regulator